MKTISYSFNADAGLPIDDLQGGITLIDDAVHVKVWKNSDTKAVVVCIVPMNGKVAATGNFKISNPSGGTYPGHYTMIELIQSPPQLYRRGKAIHGHEWQHPAVKDRRPSNWCGICKNWFIPDRFRNLK